MSIRDICVWSDVEFFLNPFIPEMIRVQSSMLGENYIYLQIEEREMQIAIEKNKNVVE